MWDMWWRYWLKCEPNIWIRLCQHIDEESIVWRKGTYEVQVLSKTDSSKNGCNDITHYIMYVSSYVHYHVCISKVGCLMNQFVLYTCNIKNLPLKNVGTLTKFKRWWPKLLVVDEIWGLLVEFWTMHLLLSSNMKKPCRCWNCLPTNCSKGGKHVSNKVSKNSQTTKRSP
jgi:hypothetical protein